MKSSNTNVRRAASSSTDFPWKWNLSDLESRPKHGSTVFSCFSCGGGSSMGYKLAGFDVIGCCEIDPDMMKIYRQNNHPKLHFLMDIRDFAQLPDEEIPEELKDLDVLDGSPPCSVFSMAGSREDGWNVEKTFREGQAKQRLDDLFLHFINVAKILQPKVVIAENVKGLITGNAKGWVNQIVSAFDDAGYKVQIFLLNSARMGVPQKRERVIFIGNKKGLTNYHPQPILDETHYVTTGQAIADLMDHPEDPAFNHVPTKHSAEMQKRIMECPEGQSLYKGYSDAWKKCPWAEASCTIKENHGGVNIHPKLPRVLTAREMARIQSFPDDFIFEGKKAKQLVQIGDAVPPLLGKAIGLAIRHSEGEI